MSEFDIKARDWDNNPMHWERSEAIAKSLQEMVPLSKDMKGMEYGAGTGMLSFLLREHLSDIVMMDSSVEMVNVMLEKVVGTGVNNLKPLFFDLQQEEYDGSMFDIIFNQMVMHHVKDVNALLEKFFGLLNPDGYLAIADLYSEDGSFHGSDFNLHKGFDPVAIAKTLKTIGFKSTQHQTCYMLKRDNGREYPIFLLIAQK